MKNTIVVITMAALAAAIAGCIISGSVSVLPSTHPLGVESDTVVPLSMDRTWAKLVAGIASSPFEVTVIDKQSGFMSVNCPNDPESFVDGGEMVSTVTWADRRQVYRFPASRAQVDYEEVVNGLHEAVSRHLDLDAKASILVSATDSNRTTVSVNVHYVLTLAITGHEVGGDPIPPYQETISFNTGKSATSADSTVFRATGALERSLLDLVTR